MLSLLIDGRYHKTNTRSHGQCNGNCNIYQRNLVVVVCIYTLVLHLITTHVITHSSSMYVKLFYNNNSCPRLMFNIIVQQSLKQHKEISFGTSFKIKKQTLCIYIYIFGTRIYNVKYNNWTKKEHCNKNQKHTILAATQESFIQWIRPAVIFINLYDKKSDQTNAVREQRYHGYRLTNELGLSTDCQARIQNLFFFGGRRVQEI